MEAQLCYLTLLAAHCAELRATSSNPVCRFGVPSPPCSCGANRWFNLLSERRRNAAHHPVHERDRASRRRSLTGVRPAGPVVIWNLVRRCNLTCQHCYSISCDKDFPGELTTEEVCRVMDDLKGVRRAGADPVRRRTAAAPRHLRPGAAREGDGFLRRPVHQRHADRAQATWSASPPPASTTSASVSTGWRRRTTASAARKAPFARR